MDRDVYFGQHVSTSFGSEVYRVPSGPSHVPGEALAYVRYRSVEGSPTHYSSINRDAILTPERGSVSLVREGRVAELGQGRAVLIPTDTEFAVYGGRGATYRMRYYECVTGRRIVREARPVETRLQEVGALDGHVGQGWCGVQVASVREPLARKDFYGLEMRILFDGKWSFGTVIFRDGLEAARHYHEVTELIHIPWGRINLYAEGKGWREFRENSAVYIPQRVLHAWGCMMADEHPPELSPRTDVKRLTDEEREVYGLSRGEAEDVQAIMVFAYDGYLSRSYPNVRNARAIPVERDEGLLLRSSVGAAQERVG